MEIRNSKLYFLKFASIGPIFFIIFLILPNDKRNPGENLTLLYSLFVLFFGSISLFFLYKAYDQKPIIVITKSEIQLRKKSMTYKIEDLAFYRIENIGSRYGRFNFIHFYDQNKVRKLYLAMVGWDKNVEDIKKHLKNKIKEIK